jgi:formylglycine-generating enzyme required for sulfatase activity
MMKKIVATILVSFAFVASVAGQEVLIPDPAFNAAVRNALQKPAGPLTEEDMLSLTNLDAHQRNVRRIDGLEAARNLVSLHLQINVLTNVAIPATLTNLVYLDLSVNSLTNCVIPGALTNLESLLLEGNSLQEFALPASLKRLRHLDLEINQLSSFETLSNAPGLVELDLGFNSFTNFALPDALTNLSEFYFAGNPLTNVVFPAGLSNMTDLNLSQNQLTRFELAEGMTSLRELDLAFNTLTNVTLPDDLRNLERFDISYNQFTDFAFPENLTNLRYLLVRSNEFAKFTVPAELSALSYLDVSGNPLTDIRLPVTLSNLITLRLAGNRLSSLTLPVGLRNLAQINLTANQLTNLVLPSDLNKLETLDLGGNLLTSIALPSGLTHLTGLYFVGNQVTNVTFPPDITELKEIGFLANPLTSAVLPEPLATTNLASWVAGLRDQGIPVYTYPLNVALTNIHQLAGAFQFAITGPPGTYNVTSSTNAADWSVLRNVTNRLGGIFFTDTTAHESPLKFYAVFLQIPPTNMVFVAPNTFTMGSPPTEQDRGPDEGPLTIVTLSRGFWMDKYEVTQGEYLSVMGANPSQFPSDLNRPVSSLSWEDATNYCAKLTARELAAGRISIGSRFRLPTEAEWECAARAGTTTRFSYGDDPQYLSLTNYAWAPIGAPFELLVHAVGTKLPNPWGIYDMAGNVFEWCQDWLGPLPGGFVIDPQGPASNGMDWKVMRGGAFDFGSNACRSASRNFFAAQLTDWNLGLRVVLASDP